LGKLLGKYNEINDKKPEKDFSPDICESKKGIAADMFDETLRLFALAPRS
jgi:hypothetical protein